MSEQTKDEKTTFLESADTKKLDELMNSTENNVKYFNDTLDKVVKSYSESMDSLMSDLYVQCIRDKNQAVHVLEHYYLELSNMIYFMIEKLEQLSIYANLSRSASKEAYSKSYLDSQVKGPASGKNRLTVAELQAVAELGSQYESVVATIYEHAHKILRGKIDSARDMVGTLRKIITHRMNEEQFAMYNHSRITPERPEQEN